MFSGKSTAAEYFIDTWGYERLAFARPVKELAADVLTLVEERIGFKPTTLLFDAGATQQEIDAAKAFLEEHYRNPNPYEPIVVQGGNPRIERGQSKVWHFADVEQKKGKPAVRKLLQLLGTEIGRELIGYEDVWVDILREKARGIDNVVVDDCRFPNEAKALREEGFTLVRLLRNEEDRVALMQQKYPTTWEEILNHPSETSLDDFEADVVISADSVTDLTQKAGGLLIEVTPIGVSERTTAQ